MKKLITTIFGYLLFGVFFALNFSVLNLSGVKSFANGSSVCSGGGAQCWDEPSSGRCWGGASWDCDIKPICDIHCFCDVMNGEYYKNNEWGSPVGECH